MSAPIWEAKAAFEAQDFGYSWGEVVNAHLALGYCISSPRYFICARPVPRDAEHDLLADPNHQFHIVECDAWFVWVAAGDLASLWTVLPHDLPFVMFYRSDDTLRIYSNSKIRRLSHGIRITTTAASTNRDAIGGGHGEKTPQHATGGNEASQASTNCLFTG